MDKVRKKLIKPNQYSDDADIFVELFPHQLGVGEKTKVRLIQAAIQCLGEQGWNQFTFEAVGTIAGMNRSQVKYHFKDLDTLLKAAIEYTVAVAQRKVIKKMDRAEEGEKQILALVHGFFEWANENPNQGSVLLLLYYLSSLDNHYRELHTKMGAMGDRRIYLALKKIKQKKQWTERELEWRSRSIWAVIDGFVMYLLSSYPKKKMNHYLAPSLSAVAALLR